ncbi:unnamed protein product [Cochlearia groenlandica]
MSEAVQNVVSYTSFRGDGILDDVLKQIRDVCWAIALIRQLNAMCRQLGLLKTSESLSIQHLINSLEKHLRHPNGAIYDLESAASILMEEGVVLDTILPLTYSLDQSNSVCETMVTKIKVGEVIVHHLAAYESVSSFEDRLKQLLGSFPVTVSMFRYQSFDNIIGDEIYFQKCDEHVLTSNVLHTNYPFYHAMLATGGGVHYEVPFTELQDSGGIERGSQGFIRVALNIGQIHHFVEMKNPIRVTERFTEKRLENFFDSNPCEKILYKLDVVSKKSQARLLADQNLITDKERDLILRKLDYMKREIMANKYPYGIHGEDVCKNNEEILAKLIGVELNTKFHTTLNTVEHRITVYKLWCLSASHFLVSGIRKLQQTLVNVALKNRKLLVPICVPAQKVQLPSLPHVFLAFVEKLECDVSRYTNFLSRLDSSSVGGYEDRDFVLEFLFVNSNTAIHISELEDVWSLWFSSESSPQDINDSPKVMCSLMSALTLSQRIPFGSNRIFQDFKDCLFSSMNKTATMINNSVKFSLALSSDLAFNQEKINQSIQPRYINELMKCVPLELKCVDEQLSNWEEKLKTT